MSVKYLTCAETAKIARKALKEAFPGVKFAVRSLHGDLMHVSWTDGPCADLVDAVVMRFKGAYFDGQIDYQGAVYHMYKGEEIRFGANFVQTSRQHSDAAVASAIDRVFRKYASNIKEGGISKPAVSVYRAGSLISVHVPGLDDLQHLIGQALRKASDRIAPRNSATAANVFPTRDDGYSRSCGEGFSVVPVENLLD